MLNSKENYKFGLGVKGLGSIFAILFSRVELTSHKFEKITIFPPAHEMQNVGMQSKILKFHRSRLQN